MFYTSKHKIPAAFSLVVLLSGLVLMLAGASCQSTQGDSRIVKIESDLEPADFAWQFEAQREIDIFADGGKPTRGGLCIYTPDDSTTEQLCCVADSWRANEGFSALVFYTDLERRSAISHFNIKTPSFDYFTKWDYGNDNRTDLALTYVYQDSLWLHVLNSGERDLYRKLISTGSDRNGSGHWDGKGIILGGVDVNLDGSDEMFISCDVGYDLYPRKLVCLDIEADSVLWEYPFSGIVGDLEWQPIVFGPEREPLIVFGVKSKGNAAVAPGMDDGHSYLVILNARGEQVLLREVGGVFSHAVPRSFDYAGDGTLEIVIPRRYPDPASAEKEFCRLEVYDLTGNLLDSLDLEPGVIVHRQIVTDFDGDGTVEIILNQANGKVLVVDQNLRAKSHLDFYTQSFLWKISDFTGDGQNELLIGTGDEKLWLLDQEMDIIASLASEQRPHFGYSKYFTDTSINATSLILGLDNGTSYVQYNMKRSPWHSVFTRHPSLAALLTFAPMALILGLVVFLWIRTRRQNIVISRQKEDLDEALKSLMKTRQKLVAVEKFRKTQEALEASEQRFRELAEMLPQTVFEADLEGRLTYTNRFGLKSIGYDETDLERGINVAQFMRSLDGRSMQEIMAERMRGKMPISNEYWVVRKDGAEYPVLSYVNLIVKDGAPAGVRGIAIDITDRKESERRLKDSEERYRNLVESASDPIFTLDRDGNFTFMNNRCAEQLGGDPASLTGHSMYEFFPPEMVFEQLQHIRSVFDRGVSFEDEVPTNINGLQLQFRVSLQPVRNVDGTIVSVLGIARDITARKESEDKLIESEDRYRSVVESAGEAIFTTDREGKYLFVNSIGARRLGFTPDRIVGKYVRDFFPEEVGRRQLESIQKIYDSGKGETFETVTVVQGQRLFYRTSLQPVRDSSGRVKAVLGIARDVTPLVEMTDQLKQERDFIRNLLTTANSMILCFDGEGRVTEFNHECERVCGVTREDALGKTCCELMGDRLNSGFAEWISTKGTGMREFQITCANGQELTVLWSKSFLPGSNGNGESMIIAVGQDITQRKRAEDELSTSEERYRLIWEASTQGICLTDQNGCYRFVNPALCKLFGYSEEEMIGKPFSELIILKGNSELSMESYQRDMGARSPIHFPEAQFRRKDGSEVWAEVSTEYLELQGQFYMVSMLTDMTARKQAEESLQNSEERYRSVWEASTQGISLTDADGRYRFVNPAYRELFGYEEEELIGQHFADLVVPEEARTDHKEAYFKLLKDRTQIYYPEARFLRKDKSEVWVEVSAGYLQLQGQLYMVSMLTDVTARKKALKDLETSEERFRKLFEQSADCYFMHDINGRFVDVNQSLIDAFGYSREEWLNMGIYDVPTANKRTYEEGQEAYERLLAHGTDSFTAEYLTKSGEPIIGEISSSLVEVNGVKFIQGIFRDVTYQRRAQQELEASEERFRNLFEGSLECFFIQDLEGRIIEVNQSLIDLFGYTREEWLSFTNENIPTADDETRAIEEASWKQLVETGAASITGQYHKKSGELIVGEITSALIELDGKTYAQGIFRDITAKQRAEKELRDSEERFRTIAEATPVGLVISRESDGEITYANNEFLKAFGYTYDELVGSFSLPLYADPEDRGRVIEILREHGFVSNLEVQLQRKNGEGFWALATMRRTSFKGESALFSSMIDITERRRVEEALQESEERFRSIAEVTPVGMVITRPSDGLFLYANNAATTETGYTEDEFLQMTAASLYAEEDGRSKIMEKLARGETINNYELVVKRKDGSEFWGMMSMRPILFDGSEAIFTSMINVSEVKEAQRQLELANREQYEQVKRMAGSLAHEIYNALFPASSTIDKLKSRITLHRPEEVARNQKLIDISERAVRRAIDMTGLVKQHSRLETDKSFDSVPLRTLLEEIREENGSLISSLEVDFELDVEESTLLYMNRHHAHSLFNNLIANALEALERSSNRKIRVRAATDKSGVVSITVSDTGAGIPEEHLPKIFRAFYSTNPTTGTGLGLATVKQIISIYNGEISVNSRVDSGTEFRILLPTAAHNSSGENLNAH